MVYSVQVVSLKAWTKFKDTTDALSAATALVEGKLSKGLVSLKELGLQGYSIRQFTRLCAFPGLKKFLKKNAVGDELAVLDKSLGKLIKEKLDINVINK